MKKISQLICMIFLFLFMSVCYMKPMSKKTLPQPSKTSMAMPTPTPSTKPTPSTLFDKVKPQGKVSRIEDKYNIGDKINFRIKGKDNKALKQMGFEVRRMNFGDTIIRKQWDVTGQLDKKELFIWTDDLNPGMYCYTYFIEDTSGNIFRNYGYFDLERPNILNKNKELQYNARAMPMDSSSYQGFEFKTTISRYPTFESPEEVKTNKEFAVQITLTEELVTSDVMIKTSPGNQKPARVVPDGRLEMKLAGNPQQKEWRIDVVLAASGFRFPKGNIASIILPRSGDSTPAVFYLQAKPIQTEERVTNIYATLWHQGTYLAKLIHKITVINPEFQQRSADTGANAQSFVSTGTQIPPSSLRGSAESQEGSSKNKESIDLPLNYKAPDLTVFILENPSQSNPHETQIIINSPHLQPIAQIYKTPHELDSWLEHYYTRFARQNARAKIIPLDQNNTPFDASLDIKGFGRELYRKYAPVAFKQAFWKLADKLGVDFDSIQILSNNPVLPWEMMRPQRDDGSEERGFLGLDFKIGRWHINPGGFQQDRPSQSLDFRKLVVIAPRYQKDYALPEQDTELRALQKIQGYESLRGNMQALKTLFNNFPKGIIHFAGHGLIKASQSGVRDYVICLEDAELDVMTWKGMIQTQNNAHPFFFFNACDVGQTRLTANFADGWAPAVLESGAGGYVSALWPLGDKCAADFAIRFYQALDKKLDKGTADIAELLRQTRRQFLQNGDPAFLAYVFYGDPHLRLDRH